MEHWLKSLNVLRESALKNCGSDTEEAEIEYAYEGIKDIFLRGS